MEQWKTIPEFDRYSVSDHGRIRNDDTGRIMVLTKNGRGIQIVGLMKGGIQYKRSLSVLVAEAFLPAPTLEGFDTPIHLDGDRFNIHVSNLMWRPRWFAVRYHQQFYNGKRGFTVPVEETKSGERFPTSWEAATKYGLLDREILIATVQRTYVWPTYQVYRVVDEF